VPLLHDSTVCPADIVLSRFIAAFIIIIIIVMMMMMVVVVRLGGRVIFLLN
jgi:hypothetical protein